MLTLHTLSIDGFGSYNRLEQLKLDEPGTTYINGPIGSGKSTILKIIYYLFFGKPIQGKSEFVSVKDYANKVLNNGYDISLNFSLNENLYEIREIRDRKVDGVSGLFFYKNSKDLRGKDDIETRKIIQKTLGMTEEDLKDRAIMTRRQSQRIVHGRSSDRAKVIIENFKLDKYDRSINAVYTDLEDIKKNKEILEAKLADYQESIKNLKSSLEQMEEDLLELPDYTVEDIDSKIGKVKQKLEKIRGKEIEVRDFLSKSEALKEQKRQLEEMNRKIDELTEELDNLDLPDESKEALEAAISNSEKKKSEIGLNIKHLREEIERIEKLGNKCPFSKEDCPVDIPSLYKDEHIKTFRLDINKYSESLKTVKTDLKQLRASNEQFEEYNKLKTELDTLINNKKLFEIPEDSEKTTKNQELLDKCKSGKERGEAKLDELREQRSGLISLQERLVDREKLQKNTKDTIKEKEKQISVFNTEIEKTDMELRYLTATLSIFKRARLYKIDLILGHLEENSNKILARISGGERKLELVSQKKASTKDKILDKLGVIVHDSDKTLPVELVSDGQETQVGLALLFGMWKTANTLSDKAISALFLDEVFGPLHQDIVNNVLSAIVEIVEDIGARSVYIISHRNLDTRLFDREFKTSIHNGITRLEILNLREPNDEQFESERRETG